MRQIPRKARISVAIRYYCSQKKLKHPTPHPNLSEVLYILGVEQGWVFSNTPPNTPPTLHQHSTNTPPTRLLLQGYFLMPPESAHVSRVFNDPDKLISLRVGCWCSLGGVFTNTPPRSNPSKQRASERFGWGVGCLRRFILIYRVANCPFTGSKPRVPTLGTLRNS